MRKIEYVTTYGEGGTAPKPDGAGWIVVSAKTALPTVIVDDHMPIDPMEFVWVRHLTTTQGRG